MIHWEAVFFKGQATAWFISLFLSDKTEWINWIGNHCSNCCAGPQLCIGTILGAYIFLLTDLFLCLFPPLVHSLAIVLNYNDSTQGTCIFPCEFLGIYIVISLFFVSTGILIVLLVSSYIWEYCAIYIFHPKKNQELKESFYQSSNSVISGISCTVQACLVQSSYSYRQE